MWRITIRRELFDGPIRWREVEIVINFLEENMAMRNRSVRLTEELDKRIVEHARTLDISASDVIKEAIYNYFRDEAEADRIEQIINSRVGKCESSILSRLDDFWNAGNQ